MKLKSMSAYEDCLPIEALLGFTSSGHEEAFFDWNEMLLLGFSGETAATFSTVSGLTFEEIALAIGVHVSSLQQKRIDPVVSARLLWLGVLFQRCEEVLESRQAAAFWLRSPMPSLYGRAPLCHLGAAMDARNMIALLDQIEAAAAA